ncbi:gasdermin-C [Perognathus longimembris pacificus]|uniref:gasdermin-C n=1 Tax=Perognathus longimembris pacificus TaxID=214514 RepID=UPI002018F03B|nr:gasdermin-C [Perognathus longimembris pacificus]
MPSLFEYVSNKMVKKLGGEDLKPVQCLLDANKFRPLNIVRKNSQSRFWERPDDSPMEYSLVDILKAGTPVPETVMEGPFLFSDPTVQKWKAGIDVDAGLELGVSGEAAHTHESTLEFQAIRIPFRNLEILQNRKLRDPEPSFLKACRRRGDNLYVVTETVELINKTVLRDADRYNTLGKLSIRWNTVKVQVQGESHKETETKLTIPGSTVMAYKKKQLVVTDRTIDLISGDAKQKTFQDEKFKHQKLTLRIVPFGMPQLHSAKLSHFQLLQQEVSEKALALAWLTKDIQGVIFHNVLSLLGDRGALKDLTDMLELDTGGHLDGPGGVILEVLQQNSGPFLETPQQLIVYLLQALMVLSDTQLHLLAQSVEKRILLQQWELVRSILEPNFKYPWCIPFTLQAEHLAQLQAEGVAITYGLLEGCGLRMEQKSPNSTWVLEAKEPLSALYGTLSLLQQLVEAQPFSKRESVQAEN